MSGLRPVDAETQGAVGGRGGGQGADIGASDLASSPPQPLAGKICREHQGQGAESQRPAKPPDLPLCPDSGGGALLKESLLTSLTSGHLGTAGRSKTPGTAATAVTSEALTPLPSWG